jgi:hypothetical protein
MNPYDWQSHHPRIGIPRQPVGQVATTLYGGGGGVVLGGRGMGKSVFLQQLLVVLENEGEIHVALIPAPPASLTVGDCLKQLMRSLGVVVDDPIGSREIVDAWFARDGAPRRLVLLFDEFDRYASGQDRGCADPPGRGFFNDLEATRRDVRGLGLMATGSLGVFVARDVLGSSFLSRALHVRLKPFERPQIGELVQAFARRGRPLSDEVFDALLLASGGIPALLTYGLQQLWELERPASERDVTRIYAEFGDHHHEYLRDLLSSVADPRLSEAPQRVLDRIRRKPGRIERGELEAACEQPNGLLALNLNDTLRLLEAAGLVRFTGKYHLTDPVVAHPIPSILNLPAASPPHRRWREQLFGDLGTLLEKLHQWSADFFRPGRERPGRGQSSRGDEGKQLVPESVFAAHLALGFELLGWEAEREGLSAAGRTDLKLRYNGAPEVAVIEVKTWGRNDYRQAQRQVESYWTAEVAAGAVVLLTDADVADWPERYRRECLEPLGVTIEQKSTSDSPIRARFSCRSTTADGMTVHVDHFLLRLSRRW